MTIGSMSAPTVLLAADVNRTHVLGRGSPSSQPGTTGPLCDTALDRDGALRDLDGPCLAEGLEYGCGGNGM